MVYLIYHRMNRGWKPVGGIAIIASTDYPVYYILAQAMIKEEI